MTDTARREARGDTGVRPGAVDALIARVLNAAAVAAQEAILEFAQRFDRREDYLPLEELAQCVQRKVLEAGLAVWRNEETRVA
jgi:hypothetical protein